MAEARTFPRRSAGARAFRVAAVLLLLSAVLLASPALRGAGGPLASGHAICDARLGPDGKAPEPPQGHGQHCPQCVLGRAAQGLDAAAPPYAAAVALVEPIAVATSDWALATRAPQPKLGRTGSSSSRAPPAV
jgi:hypothetical protein